MNNEDKNVIRELAKQVRDIAALDVNRERIKRIRDMHSLKPVRPPVWINEIPWHEMNIDDELTLRSTDKFAREMETHFRRIIYRWKHIQADMVAEDAFYVEKAYTESEIGVNVREQTVATDTANNIISHHYEDQLDTEEKVDSLKLPVVEAKPETDRRNLEIANDVLDGIMPVKLRGCPIYYAPWDLIARLRGVENCFMDMISNPDLIHKTIAAFTRIYTSRFTQMQEQGLLDFNQPALHCTPPYANELPASDYDGGKVRFKDMWFRGMAQLFSSASPQMHDEFDLQYMRPFMVQCGLSYYGCCEPLDNFIPYLKKIPNMRKIGVSPWADVRSSAEQIGGSFVLARKPNPANAARFSKTAVANEIRETIEAAAANKCPYEFVLKDISTVNFRPQNLIDWTNTVMEVIDTHYGA